MALRIPCSSRLAVIFLEKKKQNNYIGIYLEELVHICSKTRSTMFLVAEIYIYVYIILSEKYNMYLLSRKYRDIWCNHLNPG